MSKRLTCAAACLLFAASAATVASAQQTTTTTTTQRTQTVQNPDGTYTVIEYPAEKETVVDLAPTTMIPGAKGSARVMRRGDETTIALDVTGVTGDVTTYNVYAVDPAGAVSLLGPVTLANGSGTLTTKTALNRFMIVLSPESDLTSVGTNTQVLLRSAVPRGFAVVPVASRGERDGAVVGERVTATSGATSAYNVPMLGIPGFRRGTDTEVKINFTGELTGSRANIFIEPRKDGPTTIKMRFHEMKNAPAGKKIVVWAVSPDNKYLRIGQVVNTGRRNEAQIQTEVDLLDFGLFVTTEEQFDPAPTGTIMGTIRR